MQGIRINPYESGTIIPTCGLDKATDNLRRCFHLSLEAFQDSFKQENSPGKWLYFILSNQLHLNTRVSVLFNHIAASKQKLYKKELLINQEMNEQKNVMSEGRKAERQNTLNKIEQLRHSLDNIATRLEGPQQQLRQLSAIREKKVSQFSEHYQALRRQLSEALSTGGIKNASPEDLNKILAFMFELGRKPDMPTDKLTKNTVNPKIESAIKAITPSDLLKPVLRILFSPNFWTLLSCNPNLPVAIEITPVIIDILREFDKFKGGHTHLIEGIQKLKNTLSGAEKHYAEHLLSSQIKEVIDQSIYAVYKLPEAAATAPAKSESKSKRLRR